jgi:DMSO reductase anchor subunit
LAWALLSEVAALDVSSVVLRRAWLVLAAFSLGGVLLSTLHLARPWAAVLALRNLRRSWVSAEVAVAAVFSAAVLLVVAASFWATPMVPSVLAAAGVSGLLLLWTMVGIYRVPSRPTWTAGRTTNVFLAAAGALGPGTVAVALAWWGYEALGPATHYPDRVLVLDDVLRLLSGVALAALALETVLAVMAARGSRRPLTALRPSPRQQRRARRFAMVRAAMSLSAAVLLALFVLRVPHLSGAEPEGQWWLAAAYALAWSACLVGRVMFYVEGERTVVGV